MPLFPRYVPLLAALTLLFLPARLAADLVWTPEGGWKTEGGVVSGLAPKENQHALELMNKARAAEDRGSYGTALRAYKKVTRRYPNSIYAPEAFYHTGYILLARHQYLKAFAAFQEIVTRYPTTSRFNQVVGEQYRIASALLDGARNRSRAFLPGFKNREASIGLFGQVIANAPYSEYAELSLMSIAKAHQLLKNPEESIDALDRMINSYPRSILTPDAYLRLAQAHASLVEGPYYDQSSTKEAITYYEDFMILYPGDPNIAVAEKGLAQMKQVLAESKMKVGDYYFKYRRNYKAARVFYNEAITDYPDSPIAARARTKLAVVDARLAEQEKATAAAGGKGPPPPPRKKRFLFF
ncbi:MAG: outer membrane protein assembly factor BamD [Opitutaceae bacterium]|nr:outer membrane protein assembly factor BamD [Opitutaceae bacterium]